MTRRMQDLQFAAAKGSSVVILVLKVLAAQMAGARAMDTDLGAGALFERERAAAVIDMNMRQKDLVDLLGSHRFGLLDDSIHVAVRTQSHIDDNGAVLADDILIGSLQGHHAWIIGGK